MDFAKIFFVLCFIFMLEIQNYRISAASAKVRKILTYSNSFISLVFCNHLSMIFFFNFRKDKLSRLQMRYNETFQFIFLNFTWEFSICDLTQNLILLFKVITLLRNAAVFSFDVVLKKKKKKKKKIENSIRKYLFPKNTI